MKENKGIVAFKGNPMTIEGEMISLGKIAPDFTVVDNTLKEVKLSDFKGKKIVITSFPSIDTPVCAMQARKFNEQASKIGDDVVILTVSKDLPFALGRFCAAEGIKNIHTLSDYKYGAFGKEYGFLVKELGLLARGTIVIDKNGKVIYVEYVPEMTNEPNYEAALNALKS